MARVKTILQYQWIAYWRKLLRGKNSSKHKIGLLIILFYLAGFRFFQLLQQVGVELTVGKIARAELLLIGILIGWVFLLLSDYQYAISSANLMRWPISTRSLFGIRLLSLLILPSSWLMVLASLALCWPFSRAANPKIAIVAVLLFIAFSLFFSLTIANLTKLAFGRKIMALLLCLVVIGGIYIFTNREALIGFEPFSFLPTRLIVNAALVPDPLYPVIMLVICLAIMGWLAFLTFPYSVRIQTERFRQRRFTFNLSRLGGRLGGLVEKDLRYFRRLLDPYLGLLLGILLGYYLIYNESPSPEVYTILLIAIFIPNISMVSNSFGLEDQHGLERYFLFPLTGQTILLVKNLAFLIIISVELVLALSLAFWRFGFTVGILGLVEAVSLFFAYLTWGNWMSVRQPFKMQFYHFSAGGSPIDTIAGLVFCSLPGLLSLYLLHESKSIAVWGMMVILVIYFVCYIGSLRISANRLERQQENIRHALS
ncbi:MAG: hypothetical protein AB1489_36810 [Acidobacteriota bacterium]